MSDCVDCGRCCWTGCEHDADDVIRGTEIKFGANKTTKFVGDIPLCHGHFLFTQATGRMNIDWAWVFRDEMVV